MNGHCEGWPERELPVLELEGECCVRWIGSDAGNEDNFVYAASGHYLMISFGDM